MPHPLSSDQLALIVVVSILTGFIAGLLLARWVVIRLLVRADRLKNDARDHMLRAGELHNETMLLCAQIEAARRGEGPNDRRAQKRAYYYATKRAYTERARMDRIMIHLFKELLDRLRAGATDLPAELRDRMLRLEAGDAADKEVPPGMAGAPTDGRF